MVESFPVNFLITDIVAILSEHLNMSYFEATLSTSNSGSLSKVEISSVLELTFPEGDS